ncbi:ribosomal RNA small subunit methyltransferase G [Striga asiatica]|uniref:Ribosomal RNA small subunit methyltransferase G n=1 Tax=Striga asiatica TaxID=4170 RepID=A0A5A7Q979_STRAF|nr:ribosomal RNA small subunit methyltransferase G [Striga asiatica]
MARGGGWRGSVRVGDRPSPTASFWTSCSTSSGRDLLGSMDRKCPACAYELYQVKRGVGSLRAIRIADLRFAFVTRHTNLQSRLLPGHDLLSRRRQKGGGGGWSTN